MVKHLPKEHLSMAAFHTHILEPGVMAKKGITKKIAEVFPKDRNSSSKLTSKVRLLKQIKVFCTWFK